MHRAKRTNVGRVLTLGSEHATKESQRIWETKPDQGDRAMDWTHVYVFTGRTPEELCRLGVRAGTRVCVHRSRRTLVEFGDYLGCYFMDDRAAITALLQAARRLSQHDGRPAGDVYFVFTTNEEIGGVGGSYASRTLPGDLTLAVRSRAHRARVRYDLRRRPDHCLQRRTVRLRQGRRRCPDGHRHPTRSVAPSGGVGCVRVRCVAFEGQWPFAAGRAAVPADAEHPRI
jgi:hypothetical protein